MPAYFNYSGDEGGCFHNPIVYEQFFTMVCNTVRNNNSNNPDGLLVEFETAAFNAIGNDLLQIDIFGCFFHLSSNLRKHIQRV